MSYYKQVNAILRDSIYTEAGLSSGECQWGMTWQVLWISGKTVKQSKKIVRPGLREEAVIDTAERGIIWCLVAEVYLEFRNDTEVVEEATRGTNAPKLYS